MSPEVVHETQIQPGEVHEISGSLNRIAGEVNRIADDLQSIQRELAQDWRGKAKDNFFSIFDHSIHEVTGFSGELRRKAIEIEAIRVVIKVVEWVQGHF